MWKALAVVIELGEGSFQTWRYHPVIFTYVVCSGRIGKVPQSNFRQKIRGVSVLLVIHDSKPFEKYLLGFNQSYTTLWMPDRSSDVTILTRV